MLLRNPCRGKITVGRKIEHRPFKERAVMLFARLAFRGIYFPQMRRRDWLGVVFANRNNLVRFIRDAAAEYKKKQRTMPLESRVPGG